jgi:hypothetical protein
MGVEKTLVTILPPFRGARDVTHMPVDAPVVAAKYVRVSTVEGGYNYIFMPCACTYHH